MKRIIVSLSLVLLILALTFTVCSCELLGDLGKTPGDDHTHEYTEEITKAPSCSEAGEKTFTCSCGESYTEEIAKLPHTEETLPSVAPTCTETGLTEGKKCSVCGEVTVAQYTLETKAHTPSPAVEENKVDSTCSKEGSYESVVNCSVCSSEISRTTVTIEKKAHTELIDEAVAPTCTETGLTEGKHCSVCGEVTVEQTVVEASGHTDADAVEENKVDSTCSKEGSYESVVYCSVCHVEIRRNTVAIEKKAHTEVIDAAVAPTCTESGLTEGKHCSVCGEVTVAQTVVEASGHSHSEEWTTDENQHWHACHCGDKADLADHVFDAETDTDCECGYVRVVAPTVTESEVVKEYDVFDLEDKDNFLLDFAENVINPSNLELTYTIGYNGRDYTLDTSFYSFDFGTCTDEYYYYIFTVTVSCTVNGVETSAQYTYKLGLKDTSAYRVANGNFENGLDGWTLDNTVGDRPFAGIDDKTHFWGEGYPMFNVGKYFSSYADGADEASQGTLTSPYFIVNSEYATYMLGGAGNRNVYIAIENKAGEVLAIFRNTKFADLPAGDFSIDEKREMIGNTVFLANFVTYKISLAEFAGEEIRFVIHDHASSGWGVVYFDELNTYYESADLIPEGAILAENLLANKEALNGELALEITEQGDYTLDSYNVYLAKLGEAKEILGDIAVEQATVDRVTAALTEARLALAVRPVLEIEGVNKAFRLTSLDSKVITIADYVNVNGLSKITYEVVASNGAVILGSIVDGQFTVTAGEVSETTVATVTVFVYYDGTEKLAVELSVQITNDLAPAVLNGQVIKHYDIYALENKTDITIDLSENIDNPGNLALVYLVNCGGEDYILEETTLFTFTYGSYTDAILYETISVTVIYVANGEEQSIEYTYSLGMKDTTANRLANGGFENGLEGWTQVGNIGGVSTDTHYWVSEWENNGKGYEFGMDGEKMFSAYAPGALESAAGTLTSSTFTVGGSGYVTFKLGAMRDGNYVYVDVVDAETKQILARYYNGLWAEYTDDLKSGCTLIAYKADLSAFDGKEVFFRISDNADSGYGLFFADSFITYYENEPEGFETATPVGYEIGGTIYDVFNGGFEMGDVQGWLNPGDAGHVTGAEAFFSGVAYGKEGNFLYSGVEDFQAGNGREGNRGVLTSSVFEIGGTGYITFMLGGGGNALCYVQVVDAVSGELLARYHQQAMQDAVLIQYVADLSAYIGRTVRFQVVDQAENSWGCVSFDNLVTYYASVEALPEGLTAIDIKGELKYTIDNGSFETGNLDGWHMNITEAGAHNTLGWVESSEHDAGWYTKNDDIKDGSFLLTFAKPDGTNCENTKGTLQSSTFSLKQGSFVSFKFGGAGGGSNHDVYVELCRADGSVIARFYNDAPGKVNTRMNAYFYQYQGVEVDCFFRVVDNSTADYGCFVVDDFRVNLESAPEGYIAAIQ